MGCLQKQGNTYTWQFRHQGKTLRRTTGTGDARLAKIRGKAIEEKIKRAKNLVEIEETKTRKSFPLVSVLTDHYLKACELRALQGKRMNMNTAKKNVRRMEVMLGNNLAQPSTILTRKYVEEWANKRLLNFAQDGGNHRSVQSLRNTIEADLRKIRSVVSDWACQYYKDQGLLLPDFTDFKKFKPVQEDHGNYRVPLEYPELVKSTLENGSRLVQTTHWLSVAWICSYELALRANESAHLQWHWFVKRGDHYGLIVKDRPETGFKAKGTAREIQVHKDLFEGLRFAVEKITGQPAVYMLPGKTLNARHNYLTRDFAKWIRGQGWKSSLFPKAGHEMRKLKGSEWFSDTRLGPAVAQEWLGHKDISTTCKYYAGLMKKVDPLPPAW